MKVMIDKVEYHGDWESKYGLMHDHRIYYLDKVAKYTSKKKDQTHFVAGKEAEFEEIEMEGKKGKYWKVKPPQSSNFSNHSRKQKVEQTKYSGFAVSYCKDLIIAGKLSFDQWESASKKIFNFMVALDKSQS